LAEVNISGLHATCYCSETLPFIGSVEAVSEALIKAHIPCELQTTIQHQSHCNTTLHVCIWKRNSAPKFTDHLRTIL